jgi:hypothetical protein
MTTSAPPFAILLAMLVVAPALTVQECQEFIAAHGPAATIRFVFSSLEREEVLAAGVASGASEWLDVAVRLMPASDAAPGEILSMALQDALPQNPVGVLSRFSLGGISAHDACSNYGTGQIEDERPISELLRLVDVRLAAVQGVTQPELAEA